MPSKRAKDIIYCLRQHFARHGIPAIVFSDNSPFRCGEFHQFAQKYEFYHQTSSTRYPQSNGKAENAVKTAKALMTKAADEGLDPYLALLDWCNTPSEHSLLSPSQLLFGRRTRTKLPIAQQLLRTPNTDIASQASTESKIKQATYYDRGTRMKLPIPVGQTVRVKPDSDADWKKAEVSKSLPHRSYEVKLEDGSSRQRTSKHVRIIPDPKIVFYEPEDTEEEFDATPPTTPAPAMARRRHRWSPSSPSARAPAATSTSSAGASSPAAKVWWYKTRSGRQARPPPRYT